MFKSEKKNDNFCVIFSIESSDKTTLVNLTFDSEQVPTSKRHFFFFATDRGKNKLECLSLTIFFKEQIRCFVHLSTL